MTRTHILISNLWFLIRRGLYKYFWIKKQSVFIIAGTFGIIRMNWFPSNVWISSSVVLSRWIKVDCYFGWTAVFAAYELRLIKSTRGLGLVYGSESNNLFYLYPFTFSETNFLNSESDENTSMPLPRLRKVGLTIHK